MLAILANISTSMYVVLIKKSHQDSTIDSLQLLALTSLLSIVPLALLSYLCGEMTDGIAYIWEGNGSKPFFGTLLASSIMGFVLNHSTYYNTSRNSPLTHTITAQMKDVVLLVISFTVFDSGFISTGKHHISETTFDHLAPSVRWSPLNTLLSPLLLLCTGNRNWNRGLHQCVRLPFVCLG
mmetsp:Transcript_26542/g.103370  ORF Transcript_26542/g.103370 Transcript_26542/m.103370 type:complete len:181 (+) Transcript_26542:569-1111(+)